MSFESENKGLTRREKRALSTQWDKSRQSKIRKEKVTLRNVHMFGADDFSPKLTEINDNGASYPKVVETYGDIPDMLLPLCYISKAALDKKHVQIKREIQNLQDKIKQIVNGSEIPSDLMHTLDEAKKRKIQITLILQNAGEELEKDDLVELIKELAEVEDRVKSLQELLKPIHRLAFFHLKRTRNKIKKQKRKTSVGVGGLSQKSRRRRMARRGSIEQFKRKEWKGSLKEVKNCVLEY